MSKIRVLVGTRKGAFILTSDGKRDRWKISDPHFAGWEIYHLKGSPAESERLFASQTSGWFGQMIQRSDDGGENWEPVGNEFNYEGVPGTHQWYDGAQHPWEFNASGILSPRSPTQTPFTLERRTRPSSRRRTAAALGRNLPESVARRAISGNRARAAWGCTPSFWTPTGQSEFSSLSRRPAYSGQMTGARPGSRQIEG